MAKRTETMWAVVLPGGELYAPSIRREEREAIRSYCGGLRVWKGAYVTSGHSTAQVTITWEQPE